AIREHNRVDLVGFDQTLQILLVEDRNACRIQLSGKLRGIAPVGDPRDLRGRKSDHVVLRIATKDDVEVMKISASRTENENLFGFHEQLHKASFRGFKV